MAKALCCIAHDEDKAAQLIKIALLTCDRLPTPIVLRRIYTNKIAKPADGYNPEDLEEYLK